MRTIGRVFTYQNCKFKVVELASGYIGLSNWYWCSVINGAYKGFEVGDEVSLPLNLIHRQLSKNKLGRGMK